MENTEVERNDEAQDIQCMNCKYSISSAMKKQYICMLSTRYVDGMYSCLRAKEKGD